MLSIGESEEVGDFAPIVASIGLQVTNPLSRVLDDARAFANPGGCVTTFPMNARSANQQSHGDNWMRNYRSGCGN